MCMCVSVTQSYLNLCKPMDYSVLGSSVHGTGVCVCIYGYVSVLVTQSYPTFCKPMDVAHQLPLCPWDSPGKNTGVSCHSLLQCCTLLPPILISNLNFLVYFMLLFLLSSPSCLSHSIFLTFISFVYLVILLFSFTECLFHSLF